MKNLKKVLALVLAFACAFTMFAGAAFTDQADIKNTEAVDMLVALGVIQGNPDGSFKPNATVTRAEMAKMIYVMRTGRDNADSYASLSSSFTDINGHWAAGYIKYCQSMNIIAGKSATKFDPDAIVTGTEAAKMMLVTAGYKADKAGLIGSSWDQKTLALAEENGLMEDMSVPMAAGLPRDYAALILFNGINMDTVKYDGEDVVKTSTTKTDYDLVTINGVSAIVPVTVTANETVGEKYLSLATAKTPLTKISYDSDKKNYTINDEFTKVAQDYTNLMGQNVKVLYKNGDKSKVFGIYANADSKVLATGTVGKLDTVSSTETAKIKLDGTEYKLDGTLTNPSSGTNKTSVMNFNMAGTAAADLTALMAASNNEQYAVKLIDNNNNGKVDSVVVTPTVVAEVTYVGTTTITVNSKSYKFADETIYEGVKKNDWAAVVASEYTANDKALISKVDTISAKVTGTKSGSAQVDGKWYDLATGVTVETGTTYDLVIYGGYIMNAVATTNTGSTSVMYVSAVDEAKENFDGDDTQKVKAYFTDGTNAAVTVTKLDSKVINKDADGNKDQSGYVAQNIVTADKMYTFSKNSSNEYELKTLANTAGNKAGYDTYDDSESWTGGKFGTTSYADDAVVFVKAGTTVKVLTGKTVKDWDSTAAAGFTGAALINTKNGINYVQIGTMTKAGSAVVPGASSDFMYGYLTSDAYVTTLENGDKAVSVTFWNGSEEKTAKIDTDTVASGLAAGDVIAYSADGNFIKIESATVKTVAITGFSYKAKGDMAYLSANATSATSTLDDDAVVIAVDSEKQAKAEGSIDAVPLANEFVESGATKVTVNAKLIMVDGTSTSKIAAVFYDVNNEWDAAGAYTK